MKRSLFTLLIIVLTVFTVKAQKHLTTEQIPETLFGEYENKYGNWDFDFNPEFFNLTNYPWASVQGATVEDNIYKLNLKTFDKEEENYTVTVKQIALDTIQISDLKDTSVYYTYTRVSPDRIKYPPLSSILDKVKGKWYYADGSNKMYLDFKDDHLVAPDGNWYYRTYSFYDNWMPQLNVAGPDDNGGFLHFYDMLENYMSIEFTNDGYHKVKRYSDIPDEPSIALNELPFPIDGKWYSCVDDSPVQFDGYYLNPGTKRLLAKKLTKDNDMIIVYYNDGNIAKTFRIQQTDDSKYIQLIDDKGISSIYRNNKKLAAGMPVEPNVIGNWYNLKTGNIQASILEGKLDINGKEYTYNKILFDGQNYKFYNNKTFQASLRKLSENNIALTIEGNKQTIYLKKTSELPTYVVIDKLPDDVYQNWLHPVTGEWLAGFMDSKVIYKAKNWQYDEIEYNPSGEYCVHLKGADAVCSKGKNGEELCKLVERYDSILFTLKNDSYTFKLDDYDDIALVNSFQDVDYQPTAQLPEPKTGTAVLHVQYLGNAQDVAGNTIKASTNNIWFMDQLSYSATFNDKGYAMLEVPMAQAQPVYATLKNYGRVFLSPGDTLYAAFDGSWAARLENVIWMGKNAQINYDLCLYDTKFWGMAEFTNESENLLKRPINEYKQARANLTDKIRNRDKGYFKENSCSPGFIELTEIGNQVEEWEDFMRYRWMPERFRSRTTQFPSEYFDFLKEIDYNNKKYWYSENMAWFLSEVNSWLSSANQSEPISISVNDVIEDMLSSNIEMPDSTKEAMQVVLDHQKTKLGDKLISDIIQELYKSFSNEIDSVAASMKNTDDSFLINFLRKNQTTYNAEEFETIENWMNTSSNIFTKDVQNLVNDNINTYFAEVRSQKSIENLKLINASEETKELFKIMMSLKEFNNTLDNMNEKSIRESYAGLQKLEIPSSVLEIVNQKYKETLEIIAQPMPGDVNLETVAPGSADEFMAKLAQKHKGKVVYIDVWAPWCGPCRSEFQYAPALKKQFEGKDVVFVYICGSGEKDAWENCIKQFKVNGDHYYIEGKTYNELQKKYSISGIPHFMIMDKQGKIVENKSSRPSNLNETTNKLNSYL